MLLSRLARFISLTLNAATSSFPLGGVQREPQSCWSSEVKEAVRERRKTFASASEVMKSGRLITWALGMPRPSLLKPRQKHDTKHVISLF